MSRLTFTVSLSVLPLLAMALSGCSSLNLSKGLKWPGGSDKPQIPDQIVDVWTDDVLHQSGQPSKRGFGGRLMFYNRDSELPVKVDGALTVYLFDDQCEDPVRAEPVHKFIFPAETLEKHYSKSELGHSYSFWLPVEDVGGVEKKLTLIARFDPKAGGKVMTKPSAQFLPGLPADDTKSPLVKRFEARQFQKKANGEVRQVAYIESTPPDPAVQPLPQPGITTTTINLPPDFTRQVAAHPSPSAFGTNLAAPAASPAAVDARSFSSGPACSSLPATGQPAAPGLLPEGAAASVNPQPAAPPTVRSQLARFPARREALGRPIASHARTQPLRATWPSALPLTPRSAWSHESSPMPTDAQLPTAPAWEEEAWQP